MDRKTAIYREDAMSMVEEDLDKMWADLQKRLEKRFEKYFQRDEKPLSNTVNQKNK